MHKLNKTLPWYWGRICSIGEESAHHEDSHEYEGKLVVFQPDTLSDISEVPALHVKIAGHLWYISEMFGVHSIYSNDIDILIEKDGHN